MFVVGRVTGGGGGRKESTENDRCFVFALLPNYWSAGMESYRFTRTRGKKWNDRDENRDCLDKQPGERKRSSGR